ncbi:MAG: fructosamine kinase family protein [Chloroflexota bacterium]|nr:fructosamine kinase family protein [Chloroflexota bacterium]
MKVALPLILHPWLARWQLIPDGAPFSTHTSVLLPVLIGDQPAMLKVATAEEEERGAAVLAWWAGEGAARVLALEGEALLMERATGPGSLVRMAASGDDDAATRILCATAARLHQPRPDPPASAAPLETRFAALARAAAGEGGTLARAQAAATHLLGTPREPTVLHGDLHHGNVLDFGARGWLAIDPKGVYGERGYEFANIFCNPDTATAIAPGRLARLADVVAAAAGIERARLLTWVLAYAGLSASWSMEDGDNPALALVVAEIAATELARAHGIHF